MFSRNQNLLVDGPPIQQIDAVSVLNSAHYLRDRENTSDFTDTRLKLKLASVAQNHLLLLPDFDTRDTTTAHAQLRQIPGLEKGRENNRSGVLFGQLYLADEANAPITEQVAVKYTHPIITTREVNASKEFDKRFGERVTYHPLGFVTNTGNTIVGSLTRYEHNVTSLDNVLWNSHASTEQRLGGMAFAGSWLANLHNHGLIHGDAQAKNIAYDSSFSPRYIDLETATDINFGPLDTQTKRLLDVANLFDPQTMRIMAEPDEIATFIDAYTRTQRRSEYGKIDGLDILDTIDSQQEQYGF